MSRFEESPPLVRRDPGANTALSLGVLGCHAQAAPLQPVEALPDRETLGLRQLGQASRGAPFFRKSRLLSCFHSVKTPAGEPAVLDQVYDEELGLGEGTVPLRIEKRHGFRIHGL
jgi:hypothetical protein